jgi:hypothetical protein
MLIGASFYTSQAESTWEFSVQLSASVQESPTVISLTWPQDTYLQPNAYGVYRKLATETSWKPIASLPGTATGYTDTSVLPGVGYEYQVIKSTSQYTGYGYIYAGVKLPLVENRGKLLLVIENTYASTLESELARLKQDLTGDGWQVIRLDVNRGDSVASVKSLITAHYRQDPGAVKAVFLFGRVPVPYSGDIVPDGHTPEHHGAWPCDGYYGEVEGLWTDSAINDSRASDPRNRNLPGDGKFDQSTFPTPVKLMVGRVDFANMPGRITWGGPPTFPSEAELLRNYLNKNHKYRQKQVDVPRQAVVGDFFGVRNGEAFAASGWRNFAPLFGSDKTANIADQGAWVPYLSSNSVLMAFGGGAGSYTSIAGLGNSDAYHDVVTTELVGNDVKTVFALLFGSWLGDWDSEDNILRGVLALPTFGLAIGWSGRPHWFVHHMALGETIGYGARLTQNNGPSGLYQNQLNSCAGQTHIALMGDPTLRLHTVAPPKALKAARATAGVSVSWEASDDTILGYHVYRATSENGPFTRITPAPLKATGFIDSTAASGGTYMVRAVKLESSASGSYYNASQGALAAVSTSDTAEPDPMPSRYPTPGQLLPASSFLWVDDALPPGVTLGMSGGDVWNFLETEPSPVSGHLLFNPASPLAFMGSLHLVQRSCLPMVTHELTKLVHGLSQL